MVTKSFILVFYLKLTHGKGPLHFVDCVALFVVNVAGLALTLSKVYQYHSVSATFRFNTQIDDQHFRIFSGCSAL